jgi:ribonuclease Z
MSVRDLTILGCSSQQPTRFRNHGAYLVRWNGEGLLFDPGDGTQRQFIFSNIAPTVVTRIFISHFHGDHCLGLGPILLRLNLDKVTHPIHCYYPASGKKYFDRLRHGTIYRDSIHVVEHPVSEDGWVQDDGAFHIQARFLDHGVDNIGWRITEADSRKYDAAKLASYSLRGPAIRELAQQGYLDLPSGRVTLDDVSYVRHGDSLAVVIDTRPCQAAIDLAQGARLLLCESTYLEEHKDLAYKYHHMTATQAAEIAKKAEVDELILTHFSARYMDPEVFAAEAQSIFPATQAADDLKRFPFPKNKDKS